MKFFGYEIIIRKIQKDPVWRQMLDADPVGNKVEAIKMCRKEREIPLGEAAEIVVDYLERQLVLNNFKVHTKKPPRRN
jgi:hypothetical protein